jgi:hypothetical protein
MTPILWIGYIYWSRILLLMGFKKIKFALKIHRLAYGFTKNCQFTAKTDRNSVFHGLDPHILD